jgi:hypothetical protein
MAANPAYRPGGFADCNVLADFRGIIGYGVKLGQDDFDGRCGVFSTSTGSWVEMHFLTIDGT